MGLRRICIPPAITRFRLYSFHPKKTELKNSLFFQHNSQTLWLSFMLDHFISDYLIHIFDAEKLMMHSMSCHWMVHYNTINSKQIEYIFIKDAITFHKLMHLSYHHCSVLQKEYGWLVDNLMITFELSWSGSKKWKYKEDKCT